MSSYRTPSLCCSDPRLDSKQEEIAVIYDNQSWDKGARTSEDELEYAMERGMRTIIIEPYQLGHLVAGWIECGNFLNNFSILTGLGSIATSYFLEERPYICYGLGTVNLFSTMLYGVAWQFDPCSRYRLDRNFKKREELPLHALSTDHPIVLERRGTFFRSFTRITVSLTTITCCAFTAFGVYGLIKKSL